MQVSELAPLISDCCTQVLDAMYFTSVCETTQPPAAPPSLHPGFCFSLQFQGDIHGTFGVQLGESSARTVAANFLGEDEEALSSAEIAEVIGELANMLCGSIVSRIGGRRKFILTHPKPVEIPSTPHTEQTLFITLDTDNGEIHTWASLSPQNPTPTPADSQEAP